MRCAPAVAFVACLGCQQILGIEEGSARQPGDGGSLTSGGAGESSASGGEGQGASGGSTGEGGGAAGGEGGEGGSWMGCDYPGATVAFITQSAVAITGGGRGALDDQCNDQATTSGACGSKTFLAYVSDGNNAAANRLGGGPWYRPDGLRIAASTGNLKAGLLERNINITPSGGSVAGEVWTATGSTGQATGSDCMGWTIASGDATVGNSNGGAAEWSQSGEAPCNSSQFLYCFEDGP